MLTKEECVNELEKARLFTCQIINQDGITEYFCDFEQTTVFSAFEQLIKEHFDEKGNVKAIANIVIDEDMMKKIADEAIKKFIVPEPYRFEDLKKGMWVWDDKLKTLYKIKKIMHCHWFKAEYRSFVLDVKTEERKYHTGIMEFEEGRFYPATKAMQQIK